MYLRSRCNAAALGRLLDTDHGARLVPRPSTAAPCLALAARKELASRRSTESELSTPGHETALLGPVLEAVLGGPYSHFAFGFAGRRMLCAKCASSGIRLREIRSRFVSSCATTEHIASAFVQGPSSRVGGSSCEFRLAAARASDLRPNDLDFAVVVRLFEHSVCSRQNSLLIQLTPGLNDSILFCRQVSFRLYAWRQRWRNLDLLFHGCLAAQCHRRYPGCFGLCSLLKNQKDFAQSSHSCFLPSLRLSFHCCCLSRAVCAILAKANALAAHPSAVIVKKAIV